MINNSHGKRMVQEDLIALLKSFKENGIKSLAVDEGGNFLVNGEPVGGGAEYTAGNGIEITENNEIKTKLYTYHIQYEPTVSISVNITIETHVDVDITQSKNLLTFIHEILPYTLTSSQYMRLACDGFYTDNDMTFISPVIAFLNGTSNGYVITKNKVAAEATPTELTVMNLSNFTTKSSGIAIYKIEE